MKKFCYVLFVALATMFAGCEKVEDTDESDNTNPPEASQLKGTWVMEGEDYSIRYIFEDGVYTMQEGDLVISGSYSLSGNVLSMMVGDSMRNEVKVIMLYDNNVLVMRYHSEMGEGWGLADEFALLYRQNGVINASAESIQGKWYWYYMGDETVIRSMLEISGNTFDFIIPIWRERMKGTIEYQNGMIKFRVTEFLTRENLEEGNESLENLYLNWAEPGEDAYSTEPTFGTYFERPFVSNGTEAFSIFANLPAYFVKK